MSGGGALGPNVQTTGPSLSGNAGAAMGGMGLGNVGSALGGQSGAAGAPGQNFGPMDQSTVQSLNNISGLMGGQASQPAATTPPPMNSINDYYQNILGRAPDEAGLAYWQNAANNGMSMDAIKQSFLNSAEYKNRPQPAQQPVQQQVQQPVQQVQQPAPYVPTTTTWSAPQQQQVFSGPTAVTQSGGEGSGGAMNYQYRQGGIASLYR